MASYVLWPSPSPLGYIITTTSLDQLGSREPAAVSHRLFPSTSRSIRRVRADENLPSGLATLARPPVRARIAAAKPTV